MMNIVNTTNKLLRRGASLMLLLLTFGAAVAMAAPRVRQPKVTDVVRTATNQVMTYTPPEPEPLPTGPNEDLVIVNGTDTVSMILPQRNFGRFDRGLYNFLFIPRGTWAIGLTASYGELNTEDVEILSVLADLNLKGKMYSIKPSVSYFINHNQSVGLKVVYSNALLDLGSMGLDLGDDISFDLRNVKYQSETYTGAISYRNYVGLGRDKRFAVFNEVDLCFATGTSYFSREYNSEPRLTRTRLNEMSLNFSPGVCVFIMENVSFNLSFGVFGVKLHKENQTTNGIEEGSRLTSGANFRFNIFNINFGLGVHI